MGQITEKKALEDRTTDHLSGARLLDYHHAARYLSVSYWTVRDMVCRGELPRVRVGRRVLIDRNDLHDLISRNKETWL